MENEGAEAITLSESETPVNEQLDRESSLHGRAKFLELRTQLISTQGLFFDQA